MFNLINEKWIPVTCASGTERMIAPWEITDDSDIPIKVCFPRPDFNSAVTQFIIGLVQTVMTPNNVDEWLDMMEYPPSTEMLRQKMSVFEDAFELTVVEHPFMQESGIEGSKPIDRILLTSPGANTVKLNKDFFIKRTDGTGCFCLSCAAAALYTLQSLAPVGGSGILCSIRGSSPLTTIVEGPDLKTTIFLNILTKDNIGIGQNGDVFPWMSDGRRDGYSSVDNDPRMVYWSVVRRISLGEVSEGECMICGRWGPSINSYDEVNKGQRYEGWEHPLCPYSVDEKSLKPIGVRDNIGHFNQWTYMMYYGMSKYTPSKTIRQVQKNREDILDLFQEHEIRLWINGYVNDKASVKAWKEIHQPILMDYDEHSKEVFLTSIEDLIRLTEYGRVQLYNALKMLYGPRNKSDRGRPVSIPSDLFEIYWSECDSLFEKFINRIVKEAGEPFFLEWARELYKIAESILDGAAESVPLDYYSNVALSRKKLLLNMSEKPILKELNK